MSDQARQDSPEQTRFRQYCREWLADNHPGEPSERLPLSALEIMTTGQLEYLQAWQKSAYEAGLIGCDYPAAVGGGGREGSQHLFIGNALAAFPATAAHCLGVVATYETGLIS